MYIIVSLVFSFLVVPREEECVKMLIGTKCDLLEEDSEDMMKWEVREGWREG